MLFIQRKKITELIVVTQYTNFSVLTLLAKITRLAQNPVPYRYFYLYESNHALIN